VFIRYSDALQIILQALNEYALPAFGGLLSETGKSILYDV